ncbi:MAG TPA: hypothetical protein VMO47_05430 [Rhodothermales bacterium]|nr:hypothetical protein [Rhodothermales bacterium]
MDVKRLVIGTVVGTVVLYAVGELLWGMLFADFFEANTGSATGVSREEYILWSLVLGELLYALAINLGLELQQGTKTIATGLIVGAVIGALAWGIADFTHYGVNNVRNLTATVADVVLEGVRGGVTGAIVVTVLGFVGSGRAPT